MGRIVAMFALWGVTGCLFVSPAHAGTRADPGDTTVGGPKLSGNGYIWDHGSGVAEPPHIEASSYVIADLETGNVLAAKDPHGHYRPASTLKTLTAITLIPRLDPQMKVKPSLTAVNASGSAVGLDTKLSYTVNDLFHGLLMQSGNDAAIALAEAGGSMPKTLAAMNAEAHRIQATDTVARTPNGLDDDPPLTLKEQHSSAYDLALIMKQGLTLPDFRKYVGARTYLWHALPTKEELKKGDKNGNYEIGTHDHLLVGDRYSGMIGGKNGWTSHALGSFVGAATRGGHTIVISLMHAQSDSWPDARALLNWGFAERAKATPVGTLVNPIPPPAKPTPKPVAHEPVPNASSGGLGWWKVGLPAGAAAAILAGLVVGLRRRRRPTGAGPDEPEAGDAAPLTPDAAGDPDEPFASGTPPGDVKVADTSPSPETAPNPTRTWTVRLPNGSGPPGSDAAPSGESSSAGNGRAPLDGEPETDGERTVRDEPHGDEAAHS